MGVEGRDRTAGDGGRCSSYRMSGQGTGHVIARSACSCCQCTAGRVGVRCRIWAWRHRRRKALIEKKQGRPAGRRMPAATTRPPPPRRRAHLHSWQVASFVAPSRPLPAQRTPAPASSPSPALACHASTARPDAHPHGCRNHWSMRLPKANINTRPYGPRNT